MRMNMNNPMSAPYQNMMRAGMTNGVAQNANDLKRAAAMNNRPYVAQAIHSDKGPRL